MKNHANAGAHSVFKRSEEEKSLTVATYCIFLDRFGGWPQPACEQRLWRREWTVPRPELYGVQRAVEA